MFDPESVDYYNACLVIACCFLVDYSMLILEGVDVTQFRLGAYCYMAERILRVQIGRRGGTSDIVSVFVAHWNTVRQNGLRKVGVMGRDLMNSFYVTHELGEVAT